MNYFAQGIQQGADIGARSYLEKKKRDQEAVLNKARLDFEANQLREQFKGQGGLQEARQKFEAEQGGLTRTFQQGERDKDRTYGSGEREKTQAFQSGQNDADRASRASEGAANRILSEKEAAARLFLDAERLKRSGEQFDATRAWAESPENPENQSRSAYAKRLMSEMPPDITPNATTPLQNGRGAALLSSTDREALAWARANPNAPQSAAILKRLGMAQ
jgi:hypothetical protein